MRVCARRLEDARRAGLSEQAHHEEQPARRERIRKIEGRATDRQRKDQGMDAAAEIATSGQQGSNRAGGQCGREDGRDGCLEKETIAECRMAICQLLDFGLREAVRSPDA